MSRRTAWRLLLWARFLIEGTERLEAALQRVQSESAARADAHHYAGSIALRQGDYSAAVRQFEQPLRIRQEPALTWNTRDHLGDALMIQGRLSEARVHLEKPLASGEVVQGSAGRGRGSQPSASG